jgi:hypothetical protein
MAEKKKLSPFLINHTQCHKDVWGSGGTAPPLDGGEWSALGPSRFTRGERAPGTHWTGGWVSPRAGVGAVQKRKISHP